MPRKVCLRVTDAQARAVAVGQPQRDDRAVADAVFQQPVLLAGEFRHAVGVGRGDRLVLVHRELFHAAVELAGGRVHHDRVRGRLPRGLDQADLGDRVDRDIGQRVGLAAHVAGLRGQVEDDRGALTQRPQVDLADVAAHEFDVGAVEVARIGAAAEQEAVQRGDLGATGRQRVAKVGAEEARRTRHKNFLA